MELDVTCFNSYWFTATDTSLLHHKRVSQRVHWYFLQSPDICHQRPLRHWDIIRIAVPFYEILLFIFPPKSLNFCLARPNWCLAQPRVFFISIPLELVSQSLFSTSHITDSPIQRKVLCLSSLILYLPTISSVSTGPMVLNPNWLKDAMMPGNVSCSWLNILCR